MALWGDRILPRIIDLTLNSGEVHRVRERACAELRGEVVEIGFGSGLNIGHYPADVRRVAAIEPNDTAWQLAARRVAATSAEVSRAGLDGEQLDLDDASYDAALSTFTMCTIPDLERALAELSRVLRPGGRLHFAEHGLSPDTRVSRWQHRLQPLHGRVSGGCHLDRRIDACVADAGFRIEQLDTFYLSGPKAFGFMYVGSAVRD